MHAFLSDVDLRQIADNFNCSLHEACHLWECDLHGVYDTFEDLFEEVKDTWVTGKDDEGQPVFVRDAEELRNILPSYSDDHYADYIYLSDDKIAFFVS